MEYVLCYLRCNIHYLLNFKFRVDPFTYGVVYNVTLTLSYSHVSLHVSLRLNPFTHSYN